MRAIGVALSVWCGLSVASAQEAERPRVALVLTNVGVIEGTDRATGFYLPEAAHPYEAFEAAGWEVVLASPEGGLAPVDPRSVDLEDEANAAFHERFVEGRGVQDTVALSALDPSNFDAVYFAGGHGTMWDFPEHPEVARVAEGIHRQGGVVAAVCHGPAALIGPTRADGSPLIAGLPVTGFTNAEEEAVGLTEAMPFLLETRLRELGGEFTGAENFAANVCGQDRVITGQNPASARGVAEAVVEAVAAE